MSTVNQALLRLFSRTHAPRDERPDLSSQVNLVVPPAEVVSYNTTVHSARFDAQSELRSTSYMAGHNLREDRFSTLAGPHFSAANEMDRPPLASPTWPLESPAETPLPAPPAVAQPAVQEATPSSAWVVDRFELPEACRCLLEQWDSSLRQLCGDLANMAKPGSRVVVVTSASRGEGRSTLAICLAQAGAAAGLRVALVDGDLEQPTLGTQLGLASSCNWIRALREGLPIAEACVRATENGFSALPLAERPHAATLPSSDQVAHMLRQLAATHDLVLVDAPPLALGEREAGSVTSAHSRGAAILVRDTRRTSDAQLRQLVAQVHAAGLTPHGVVENFSHPS